MIRLYSQPSHIINGVAGELRAGFHLCPNDRLDVWRKSVFEFIEMMKSYKLKEAAAASGCGSSLGGSGDSKMVKKLGKVVSLV